MAVVGDLSVNLGLNSAGFSGGISQAGVAARKFSEDFKTSMKESEYSTMEARHAIMMLGEEIGVRMPRGVSMFLSSLAPVGGAMAMAFPLLAITALVPIIEKIIGKINEFKDKANASATAWATLGTDGAKALHKLNEELLASNAKIDDLNGNRLASLQKRLKLIDETSLDKLGEQFKTIAADADKVLSGMQVGWWQKFLGKGEGVDQVISDFNKLENKLQELKEAGDTKGFQSTLQQGIKDTMNRQDELNAHASSFHTEERAALAARLNVEILMTQEMEKQDKLASNQKVLEQAQFDAVDGVSKVRKTAGDKAMEDAKKYYEFVEHATEQQLSMEDIIARAMATEYQEQLKQNQELAKSQDDLYASKIKATASGGISGAKIQAELGISTKKEEAQKILAIDKQELEDFKNLQAMKLADLKQYADQSAALAKSSVGTNRQDETQRAAVGAQIEYNKALAQNATEQQALTNKVNEQAAAVQKLSANWSGYFGEWKSEAGSQSAMMATLGKTIQTDLTSGLTGFSNALAKTAVEGKNLGTAMKNVAKEMAESFISATIQMLLKYIMLKVGMGAIDKTSAASSAIAQVAADKVKVVSAAGVAGAEGTASFAGAPWPVDLGAPAFGATMAATAMGFGAAEQGGLVGYDDMIIAAHKNEMVLPAPLSQKVQNMTDPGKQSGGHDIHVHYSPTVHTIDGKGMSQVLNEHSQVIEAHVKKAMRRQNR